jgi:hypothetical protein
MLTIIKRWKNPEKIFVTLIHETCGEEIHLVCINIPFKTREGKKMVVNKELELSEVKK